MMMSSQNNVTFTFTALSVVPLHLLYCVYYSTTQSSGAFEEGCFVFKKVFSCSSRSNVSNTIALFLWYDCNQEIEKKSEPNHLFNRCNYLFSRTKKSRSMMVAHRFMMIRSAKCVQTLVPRCFWSTSTKLTNMNTTTTTILCYHRCSSSTTTTTKKFSSVSSVLDKRNHFSKHGTIPLLLEKQTSLRHYASAELEVQVESTLTSEESSPTTQTKPKKQRRDFLQDKNPIILTDKAAARVQELLATSDDTTIGLRLGVKRRGCNGLSYTLNYATPDKVQKDIAMESHGIKVYIEPMALFNVVGTVMDWEESEMASEFTFQNPNSKGECGCGESFNV